MQFKNRIQKIAVLQFCKTLVIVVISSGIVQWEGLGRVLSSPPHF